MPPSLSITVVAAGSPGRAADRSPVLVGPASRTAAASRRASATGRGAHGEAARGGRPAPARRAARPAGRRPPSVPGAASRRPIRKATGARPITPNVIRRIVSNAGSSNAPASRRTAIITSPSAKESTSSATERRSGRPDATPADGEQGDPGQAERAQREQLNILHGVGRGGLDGDREQVVGSDAAEHHLDELQAHRRHVRQPRRRPAPAPLQATAREREEHMQEERHRHQVEGQPDRVRDASFAHCRLDRNVAKPATIISGPKRLSGRRHQAISPRGRTEA